MRQMPIPALPLRRQVTFWLRTRTATNGCIEWQGSLTNGYGRFRIADRVYGAHRIALSLHLARDIPLDLVVDHLCRNTRCVNPDHLEEVTYQTNGLRGINPSFALARIEECSKGHPRMRDGIESKDSAGRFRWRCRECERERDRARANDPNEQAKKRDRMQRLRASRRASAAPTRDPSQKP